MLCESLVHEGVVRREQIDDSSIFADDAAEQQFHFAAHRLPQRIIEVREQHRDRPHSLQTAQVQPLPGEVDGECFRLRVFQHPPHLLFEHGRIFEFSLAGRPDQFIIRTRAPQKERQP